MQGKRFAKSQAKKHLSTGEANAKVRGLGKTQNASTFVLKTEI